MGGCISPRIPPQVPSKPLARNDTTWLYYTGSSFSGFFVSVSNIFILVYTRAMERAETYPPEFFDAVTTLLQHEGRVLPSGWESMQMVRDISLQGREQAELPTVLLLEDAMAQLEGEDPLLAKILRLRFWEGETLQNVGSKAHRSLASVHRDLKTGQEKLAQILWEREQKARDAFRAKQIERLEPSSYDRLFGIENSLNSLKSVLLDPEGPHILMVTGMGGIGKTSLADYLSRNLIDERAFAAFGWVSLRPTISLWDDRPFFQALSETQVLEQIFERLGRQLLGEGAISAPFSLQKLLERLEYHLKQSPHFIVVDNLEILSDLAPLMSELKRLAGPSRFIVTSRVSHFVDPNVYHFKAPPLTLESAKALLRHEGRKRNIRVLQEADDEVLADIYHRIGGNPLALRLVAGQLHTHSLKTVLDDLTQARGRSVARLFDYIYRRGWDNLDENAQRVLLAMPLLPPEGGVVEQIIAITGLSDEQVHDALEVLVQLNLVDHQPSLTESRYAIHSLTRTFLQQQAARWG